MKRSTFKMQLVSNDTVPNSKNWRTINGRGYGKCVAICVYCKVTSNGPSSINNNYPLFGPGRAAENTRGGSHDVRSCPRRCAAARAQRPARASDGSRAARLPASASRPPAAVQGTLCAAWRASHSVAAPLQPPCGGPRSAPC